MDDKTLEVPVNGMSYDECHQLMLKELKYAFAYGADRDDRTILR